MLRVTGPLGGVVELTLDRPERRNSLSLALMETLTAKLRLLCTDPSLRVVVLGGSGTVFCAGADLAEMAASGAAGAEKNLQDAWVLADLFLALAQVPVPVVGRIQGAAAGGGVGLVCLCDIAVAHPDSRFLLSETSLGLVPAVISPFVTRRLGPSLALPFLLGAPMDAHTALARGLVHYVSEDPHSETTQVTMDLLRKGPQALRRSKELWQRASPLPTRETLEPLVRAIAAARASSEGQEGVRAWGQKRPPSWTPSLGGLP